MSFDHVLVIGFGGPTKKSEIKPFIETVTKGIPIPETRLREVEHHYEVIGGSSPYNEYTFQTVRKLESCLHEVKNSLPLFLGMRNWNPFLKDTFRDIKAKNLKKGIGVILAPHRSDASFEKYIRNVEDAKKENQASVEYEYIRAWHDHPLFIEAQAAEVKKVLERFSKNNQEKTHVLFSAHSIPLSMAEKCHYAEEFHRSSQLVAEKLGVSQWSCAYQSRSGNPRDPWLEPEVGDVMVEIKNKGFESVLLVPVGFLCDNAEVLYDLDIEAKRAAEAVGLMYFRARTVTDHPKFIEMLVELIQEKTNKLKKQLT